MPLRIGSEHHSEGSPDVRFAPQLLLAPPAPQKPSPVRYRRTFVTRHDALASLGGNHAFRKCVAELLKHRGEERSQEQSEYPE